MLFWIVLAGIALDQFSKAWVVNNLPFEQAIPIVPKIFSLTYIHNEGAAWSILDGHVNFLIIFSSLILVLIGVFYFITPKEKKVARFGIALIIAGAFGNLIDRISLGYVVDFIQFPYWPVFNVADCLLFCGVVVMIICFWQDEKKLKKQKLAEALNPIAENPIAENIVITEQTEPENIDVAKEG